MNPCLGIQQALPEGSLLLLGYISVDGIELSVRAINEDPVFLTAGPPTTTVPFTRSHVLRAVARDTRGATTTDAIIVTCH